MEPQLTNTSIVLLVKRPSTTTFSLKYFKQQGLLQNRLPQHQLYLPPISQYRFDDGLIFEAVEQRVKLELPRSTEADEPLSPEACFAKLLEEAVPLVHAIDFMEPYAVGLNYFFELVGAESLQAFRGTLSGDTMITGLMTSRPHDGHQMNQHFRLAPLGPNGTGKRVEVETNFHFDLNEGDDVPAGAQAASVVTRMQELYGDCLRGLQHVQL